MSFHSILKCHSYIPSERGLVQVQKMLTHIPTSHAPLILQLLETNNGGFSLTEGAVAMPTYAEAGSLGSF